MVRYHICCRYLDRSFSANTADLALGPRVLVFSTGSARLNTEGRVARPTADPAPIASQMVK